MDFDYLCKKERHVYVWIDYMYEKFKIYSKINKNYTLLVNKVILPIKGHFRLLEFKKITNLCLEGVSTVKMLNGNHYHMYLFLELIEMIKEIK